MRVEKKGKNKRRNRTEALKKPFKKFYLLNKTQNKFKENLNDEICDKNINDDITNKSMDDHKLFSYYVLLSNSKMEHNITIK